MAGNFNTLIMLRVKELATAEMLSDQLPRVEVFTLIRSSLRDRKSTPDLGSDESSTPETLIRVSEVPMLTPADVVRLLKGQAFALLEGSSLSKL